MLVLGVIFYSERPSSTLFRSESSLFWFYIKVLNQFELILCGVKDRDPDFTLLFKSRPHALSLTLGQTLGGQSSGGFMSGSSSLTLVYIPHFSESTLWS